MKKLSKFVLFVFSTILFCQINSCKSNNNNEKSEAKSSFENAQKLPKNNKSFSKENDETLNSIPEKVYKIRDYVRENGQAKQGYVGGRKFKNLEKRLPIFTNNHLKISYQEWDVNKKKQGVNRGTERLITGSNGSDYYTNDHYRSFQKLKEK